MMTAGPGGGATRGTAGFTEEGPATSPKTASGAWASEEEEDDGDNDANVDDVDDDNEEDAGTQEHNEDK